ncbi:MAG: CRISPR-associated endonuclease Cas1 [Calditrichia bacterium]
MLTTIYLTSNSGRLGKKGETLQLQGDNNLVKTIYPFRTSQIFLIGNIDISTPALKLLMKNRIDTVFLSKNGKFNGRLVFRKGKNVFLRQKQFKSVENPEFVLQMARSIAKGKITNQALYLKRIRRERKLKDLQSTIGQVYGILEKLETADNLDSVRGYEGAAARLYFSKYANAFIQDYANFPGRSMNPPKSNVNAVLSFIYTLILSRVEAALESEGLDPYVGYLHRMDYGKTSLAFDLMEEYRVPLGDTLTAALFNQLTLKEDDFREVEFNSNDDEYFIEKTEEDGENGLQDGIKGVLLTTEGLRKVIAQFEKKMETEILHSHAERRMSYKQLIFYQIRHFKRVINGEEYEYKPMVLR